MDHANGGAQGGAPLYLFPALARAPWWRALTRLLCALEEGAPPAALPSAHAELFHALAEAGYADLRRAAAISLLGVGGPLDDHLGREVPEGLLRALEHDLTLIRERARAGEGGGLGARSSVPLPPLQGLAPEQPAGTVPAATSAALAVIDEPDARRRVRLFLEAVNAHGTGPAALYEALRWTGDSLVGVPHASRASWSELALLEEQLSRIERNVEALLARAPAHHMLLYGPRGSGKSTAVRGLLERFADRGLRLVEVAPEQLPTLPALVELLRPQPLAFALFVDDLSFDGEGAGLRPLRSLLEGGLAARPGNVVLVATSNRRHLVSERLGDRPAPEDDVHGWDTHNERLALADRFGLTVTFPSTSQRSYLELVRALAARRGGLKVNAEEAIRFAQWGNGYSGRTARQYVDELTQA